MDKLFAVVSRKAYVEDWTHPIVFTELYDSYISAYENLCESNAGCIIKEVKFDYTKEFEWDVCIMMLDVEHKNKNNIIAKYPIEYYSIKKSYTMYDTNPIRLIDLMQTLYVDAAVQLFIGFLEDKYEYNNLEEIPDKYFNYKVKGIGYHIEPITDSTNSKIITRIKIEA